MRGAGFNGYQWVFGNDVIIGDDEGTAKVTQNSQNYAFYASAIDAEKTRLAYNPIRTAQPSSMW